MAEDLHFIAAFVLLLIYSALQQGSSAEDTVYVKTGASVQLNIHRDKLPAEFNELSWDNDKSHTLVKFYKIFNHVENYDPSRVDFNNKIFSLTLKNMQKSDSGVYTAQIPGKPKRNIAVYTVSVIDVVEAPLLSVDRSNSDRCTVNVTCRGHDLTLNSTFLYGSCPHEEVTSQGFYTLSLTCSEETIICNHSNPVSWRTDRHIQQLCERGNETIRVTTSYSNSVFITVILLVVAGVIVFCGLVLYCCRRNKKGIQKDDNTDYDDVKTLTRKQEMSDDTWTTVIYHTSG